MTWILIHTSPSMNKLCVYKEQFSGFFKGYPLEKRFLGLFGLSVANPADLSGFYNIKVPGDATGYLDISHQQQSAGATGTGYVQHQGQNGPGCKGF